MCRLCISPEECLNTLHARRHTNRQIDSKSDIRTDNVAVLTGMCSLLLGFTHVPSCSSEDVSYLADHAAPAIGLRLTSDGYLTADMHLDLPPLKCVLLDPYTG